MTKEECAIVTLYTGVAMLEGDDLEYLYRYAEKLMERPVFTHELAALADELKKRAKPDFINLCRWASAQPELGKNTMPEQPKTERLGVKTGETCTDVINRQEAIETAENVAYAVDEHESAEGWLAMLINSLEILPPVQPEERTIKRTETHACDLISRQAAIDAIQAAYIYTDGGEDKNAVWTNVGLTNALHIMQDLPSAHPEQRCVNCGRTANNGGWYEDGRTRCPIEEHYALPKDGYCHLWEKRKDWEDDYVKRPEEGEK